MVVIKQGRARVKPVDIYRGTCGECGAIVEAEIFETKAAPRHGFGCRSLRCPTDECDEIIIVNKVVYRKY
jgi:hypothetical protein